MAFRPLRLFYCDQYPFPLPDGHKFPLAKYSLLREALANDKAFELQPAPLASAEEIAQVHDENYFQRFLNGTAEAPVIRRIGFPWSPELVTRTLASVGSTLSAARAALETGFGGTLAGGTHHASRTEGSGFCVFNDIAIAIEWLRHNSDLRKFGVIDLDVHQGDGTAAIFAGDGNVFTLSIHGERNFPFRKQRSTLDVPLPDGVDDQQYLKELANALEPVRQFRPEFLVFQAGVDGLRNDKLGRLGLTHEGLQQRDRAVMQFAKELRLPIVITIGGGYSENIGETVRAHAQTFRIAAEHFRSNGEQLSL